MDRQAGEVLRNSRMQSTVRKEGHMFKLEFKTDNAAFADDFYGEVHDLLKKVADDILTMATAFGSVVDSNGNTIGHFELTEDE